MAKAKTPAATKKPAPQFIHEINSHNGEHRVVVISDGTTVAGEWTPNKQIATNGDLRAATDQYAGLFPVGIFKVSKVATISL